MSPRAAWRLERLGFDRVYDYVAGKVDWLAAGLATVRREGGGRRALDGARRDVATCAPDTPLRALPTVGSVVVVVDDGVVLGRVEDRSADPDTPAEAVMAPGPTTVRAHEPLDPLLERMAARNVDEVLVTTPEGQLLGAVRR